jgi:exodeoxyribonuclease-3
MLKIATWNVNGIRARENDLLEFLERERPDVLCLQEIKASPDKVPESLCALAGYHGYWHGYKGYSGVSLHISREISPGRPTFQHPEFDHETRIVTAQLGDVLIASIYVPNGGKDLPVKMRFLGALEAFVASAHAAGTRLLLCGDLNVAREDRDVHPELRKPKQTGRTPEEQAQFARILGLGLTDLSRQFAPDDDQLFSWWAPWRNQRDKNIGWRIDYVLASSALATAAQSCSVQREFGSSDHGPLLAVFDLTLTGVPLSAARPEPAPAPKAPESPQLQLLLPGLGYKSP